MPDPVVEEKKEEKKELKPGEHEFDLPENQPGWTPASDPLLRTLMESFGEQPIPAKAPEDKVEDEKKEEPKTEVKEDDKTKAAEEKTESKQEEKKQEEKKQEEKPAKKPVSFQGVVDNIDDIRSKQEPEPAPKKQAEKQYDDADYVATLSPDIQDEIADASDAESFMAEKYNGQRKKVIDYYKRVDALVEKLRTEDPSRSLDANDDEFVRGIEALKKSKPTVSVRDRRQIDEKRITERVRADMEQKFVPKMTELERKNEMLEKKPKVEAAINQFENGVKDLLLSTSEVLAPVLTEIAAIGDAEKAREAYGLEMDIIEEKTKQASAMAREFMGISAGLVKFDPRNMSETQQDLNRFLIATGDEFERTGGKLTTNGAGQKFLPLHKYNALLQNINAGKADQSEAQKYWTFNEAQVLGLIAVKAKGDIEATLKAEEERSKRYGFQRVRKNSTEDKKPAEKKTEEKLDPINPPRARQTQSKGVSETPAKKTEEDPFNPIVAFGLGA